MAATKSSIAIAEVRAQAVAKEIEKKNNLMRLKWFEENYERVYMNPALPKEKVPKNAGVLYEELRKMRQERFKADRELKVKTQMTYEGMAIPDEDICLDIMYPVPSELIDVLFKGVSHDEEGRYKYLKLRNKEAPHEKFRGKETTGFEYGWRIEELGKPPRKDFCRRSTWSFRVNGAFKGDDPNRRSPSTVKAVIFPFL